MNPADMISKITVESTTAVEITKIIFDRLVLMFLGGVAIVSVALVAIFKGKIKINIKDDNHA